MFGYADRLANCGCFLCFLEHIFFYITPVISIILP